MKSPVTRSDQAIRAALDQHWVPRIIGNSDLWITEYILTYDGKPSWTVSIMEFSGETVVRETQYSATPFEASAWRAQLSRTGTGRWLERTIRGAPRVERIGYRLSSTASKREAGDH